jgi:CHASE3 domain sensor protein
MSNKLNINLFHIVVVAPLLIYLGICKDCNDFIKKITLIFGITVLVYHSYEVYILMNKKKSEKYTEDIIN